MVDTPSTRITMQPTVQELRLKSLAILHDISGWVVSERIRLLQKALEEYKAGFNPDQPRAFPEPFSILLCNHNTFSKE